MQRPPPRQRNAEDRLGHQQCNVLSRTTNPTAERQRRSQDRTKDILWILARHSILSLRGEVVSLWMLSLEGAHLTPPPQDGDAELVRDASVCIEGAHGQFITNVHLRQYATENDFHKEIYPEYRERLFGSARKFLQATNADPQHTLVLIRQARNYPKFSPSSDIPSAQLWIRCLRARI